MTRITKTCDYNIRGARDSNPPRAHRRLLVAAVAFFNCDSAWPDSFGFDEYRIATFLGGAVYHFAFAARLRRSSAAVRLPPLLGSPSKLSVAPECLRVAHPSELYRLPPAVYFGSASAVPPRLESFPPPPVGCIRSPGRRLCMLPIRQPNCQSSTTPIRQPEGETAFSPGRQPWVAKP